ncbi:MAG: hypothetical protein AAF692_00610 [Pseudomonadota bacterium]
MSKSASPLPRKDRVSRELDAEAAKDKIDPPRLLPSPEATTNLLIADIVVRGASRLFRDSVERRVAKASAQDEGEAEALLDGKTLIKSLAIYGASKLATRSPVGLGLVAGGLAVKTLYDRGKARQRREALADQAAPKEAEN